jgi:hypothetical protein
MVLNVEEVSGQDATRRGRRPRDPGTGKDLADAPKYWTFPHVTLGWYV